MWYGRFAPRSIGSTGRVALLVVLLASIAIAQQAPRVTHAAASAARPRLHWSPEDKKAQAAYEAREEPATSANALMKARAQAARLPKASHLPPSKHHSAAGDAVQVASGVWHPIGPSPASVNFGGGNTTTLSGSVSALAVDPTTSYPNTTVYLGATDGGVWKTVDGGAHWSPLTDNQVTLAISTIAIDPANHNIIYAGTGENIPDAYVAVNGLSSQGILKSTDGGQTWTLVGTTTFQNWYVFKIAINPYNDQQLWVATSDGLYVSNDGGVTYSAIQFYDFKYGVEFTDVELNSSVNPVWVYATANSGSSLSDGIYRSTDGGVTWAHVGANVLNTIDWRNAVIAVAPSNPNYVYAMDPSYLGFIYYPGNYNGAFYSTDGGYTWHQMTSLNINFTGTVGQTDLTLAVDPTNPLTVYAGGVDIVRTTNATAGAGNWQNISDVFGYDNSDIAPYQHAMAFAKCSTYPCPAYFGNDGGVFFSNTLTASNPQAVTYTSENTPGLSITTLNGGDIGPNFVNGRLAVGAAPTTGVTQFSGDSTQPTALLGDAGSATIDNSNPNTQYTQGFGTDFIKTTNDWTTAQTINSGLPQPIGSGSYFVPFAFDRSNDQHLVAAPGGVYESLNGGATWYNSSQSVTGNANDYFTAVAIAPTNSNVIYAGTESGDVVITTHGASGSGATYYTGSFAYNITAGGPVSSISVDPGLYGGGTAYLTTTLYPPTTYNPINATIWKTTNGGLNWASLPLPVPNNTAIYTSAVYDTNTGPVLVVGTGVGAFYTTNDGSTWYQLNDGLPNVAVTHLAIDPQQTTIVAFTRGRGEWYMDIPETAGGTGDTPGVFRPATTQFHLRNSLTTGPADETVTFGGPTMYPIAGDWFGDGVDRVGVYDSAHAVFYLKSANSTGAPNGFVFSFGAPGDIPVVGDWTGQGHDSIGVFRPSTGTFYLRNNLSTGGPDDTLAFGASGDMPVAGDWSGQGHDSIGVYRPSSGMFFLTNTICNCAPAANYIVAFGVAGDVPFTGDWTHSGKTGLGVFRTSNGLIYLRNDATTTGFSDYSLVYGIANDNPIAGHWL